MTRFVGFTCLIGMVVPLGGPAARQVSAQTSEGDKEASVEWLRRQKLEVDGRPAFLILPQERKVTPTPWVLYAPTLLPGLPGEAERWMFERFLKAGIAIAGVDIGESYGSPKGRATYNALHKILVEEHSLAPQACLLARSRGGLMLYAWAADNPDKVRCITGIYPVCNLASYPGLDKACAAYGMTTDEMAAHLAEHNPVDRLAPLAKAGIPLFHIHGDIDQAVPLEANSGLVATRYKDLGGSMQLVVPKGQGHNLWPGFFQCRELVDFLIQQASGVPAELPAPIAHWKSDDAGDEAIDSAGKHHGTIHGAVSAEGRIGGALLFDRSRGDHVSIPYSADFELSSFTVAAWVKLTKEPTFSGILGTRFGGEFTFDMKVNADKVHGDVGDGERWIETNVNFYADDVGSNGQGGDLATGRWYHVAFVVDDAAKQFRLYLDGDKKKEIAYQGAPRLMKPGQTMRIGCSSGDELMDGLIDDAQISNEALSDQQVQTLALLGDRPLEERRQKAVQRRRRVIYNNDGDDIWAAGADSAEKFLALRHTPLLGTQVDSIFYCTTQSFNLFTHQTRKAEVFVSQEASFAHNNLPNFLEQGTDGLRMSCDFAHRNGLESFWTLRMNDIHDAWTPQFVSGWKKADPRRVMSTLETTASFNDRRRLWSLVDFEQPDVEPQLLAIIAEVLESYPVEGIELDFLRAPCYFRSSYEGKPVDGEQKEILTRLVRKVYELVLAEGRRRNSPVLLAARVPTTVELCSRIGIDIEGWLNDGLVDLLTLGGGYVVVDQPIEPLVALGHRHEVPVYACLSQSGLLYRPPRGNGEPQPSAAWFGAALRCFDAGADGIYAFNLFPGPGPEAQRELAVRILKSVGTRETLLTGDVMFAVADAGNYMPAHYWAKDAEEFSSALPIPLDATRPTTVRLVTSGSLPLNEDQVRGELRLDFVGLKETMVPPVGFNFERPMRPEKVQSIADVTRCTFKVPVSSVALGANRLVIDPAADAKLVGAELWIIRSQ